MGFKIAQNDTSFGEEHQSNIKNISETIVLILLSEKNFSVNERGKITKGHGLNLGSSDYVPHVASPVWTVSLSKAAMSLLYQTCQIHSKLCIFFKNYL